MKNQCKQKFEEIDKQLSTLSSQHKTSIAEISELRTLILPRLSHHDSQILCLQQFTDQIDIIEFNKACKVNDDAISEFKKAVESSQN